MSKAKFYFVYSTLTANMLYGAWTKGGGDVAEQKNRVLIYGGAGITDEQLITPRGVATKISDAQEAILRNCPMFQFHEKGGYVVIDEDDLDADSMSDSMKKDISAPLQEKDFKNDDVAIVVNGEGSEPSEKVETPGKVSRTARKPSKK